jgi:hypothetical protein
VSDDDIPGGEIAMTGTAAPKEALNADLLAFLRA